MRNPQKILVGEIHLHFGTCLKTCLWNPGTHRHKIVLLSSAYFGLVTNCVVGNPQRIFQKLFNYYLIKKHNPFLGKLSSHTDVAGHQIHDRKKNAEPIC